MYNNFNLQGYDIPEFFKTLDDLPHEEVKMVDPTEDINNFAVNVFYRNINKFESMDQHQRQAFVKSNIDLISDHIMNSKCNYATILFTPAFLEAYFKILSIMPITALRKFASNFLFYTFKTNMKYRSGMNQDQIKTINNLFMAIARVVNRDLIRIIESVGIPNEYATEISVARFSYTDEITNAHRVNQVMMYSRDPSIFTEQNIIYVYEKLFNQLRYLFMAVMFDVQENYEQEFPDDDDAFYYVFSNISLAALTMANNLPIDGIYRLLSIFLEKWNEVGKPRTRFSLRSLSADYGRVLSVVERMGVYVP